MLWEGRRPCFSKTPLALPFSSSLLSEHLCPRSCFQTPECPAGPALAWLVYPGTSWFSHSHSRNSFLRTGRGKRTPEEESRLSLPPSFPLTSFWTWETSDSPPAKSLHSVQLSSLNDMATPFLPHHVRVDMAVILP